ncbi:MAG: AAA family ATPase [Proteobacteria bacterium]|nr:AAA family ATPase [Pseudomonadota bacterium]
MIPQVAFFNHKGGVSKTTSVFNVSWKLAEIGLKVLMVDCDPQCNLTGLVLNYNHDEDYPFESNGNSTPRNIRHGLSPAFDGRPIPLAPVETPEIPNRPGLFLLPGHVAFSENESSLSIAHELSTSLSVMQNIPGSLRHLFQITAEKIGADVIVIDMSPSLGSINQNILTTSEYFIVPMAPDFFSAMALRSLARVLPRWMNWSNAVSKQETLQDAAYPWPDITPTYIGSIVQNYRKRARGGGEPRPTTAYQKWFDELTEVKSKTLITALKEQHMIAPEEKYFKSEIPLDEFLMEIPDFNSLIAFAQNLQKPVFALTKEDIGARGTVADIQLANRDHFNEIYEEGSRNIANFLKIK